MNRIFSCALLCATIFAGCKKENVKPAESNKIRIAQTIKNNMTITLWSDIDTLTTGYNKLYISVADTEGKEVKAPVVNFIPMMNMTSMQHSSPVEQPVYNPQLKLSEGAVVFTMPSSEMGTWQLEVTVNETTCVFPLSIKNALQKRVVSFVGTDENKYILTMAPPAKWQVGINNLNILVHRQSSKTQYPAESDFIIEFAPEMPSMGHGSPNNVNPVSMGNGHYQGKVNFTMTGEWRLNFTLKKNGAVVKDQVSLDVTF